MNLLFNSKCEYNRKQTKKTVFYFLLVHLFLTFTTKHTNFSSNYTWSCRQVYESMLKTGFKCIATVCIIKKLVFIKFACTDFHAMNTDKSYLFYNHLTGHYRFICIHTHLQNAKLGQTQSSKSPSSLNIAVDQEAKRVIYYPQGQRSIICKSLWIWMDSFCQIIKCEVNVNCNIQRNSMCCGQKWQKKIN